MARKSKVRRSGFWTKDRESKLLKHFRTYNSHPYRYARIATIMRASSTNSVYKKLGRMGMLDASWSKREKKSRRR